MSPAFTGGTTTTRTLFVPYGSKSAYTEDTANSENSLNTWNPNVSSYKNIHKIKEFLEVEIKATVQDHYGYGCATFYSDNPFYTYYSYPLANPTNSYQELKCSTASVSEGELTLNWEYGNANTRMLPDVVPGKTAVVIYGLTGTHYPVIYEEGDDEGVSVSEAPENNMLLGSEVATETTGPNGATEGYKFYKFTYESIESGVYTGLGFYWDQANGAAFTSAAFKAWLAVPDDTADAKISSFVLGEDNTTGISSVDSSKPATDAIYNLQGIRVNDMSRKGIYIVGGKKVIKK
ncbi:MAG: hypothetical protein LUC26_01905 [Prevotella sp.]|nr:hypothetical protein [Prevotella sp.]